MGQPTYLTVTALTKYLQYKLKRDPHLQDIYVRGELSNVKIQRNIMYATLKDEQSQLRTIAFSGAVQRFTFQPESGMDVIMRGRIDLYERYGQHQLYVEEVIPAGEGALFVALRQLKEKLEKEGLFDPRWKQPLPRYPEKIGIVTSKKGAALQDMKSTILRRYPIATIILFEAVVQGEKAPQSIVQAVEEANEHELDVLIVARGGGSIEDLWAFNDERVVRTIFSTRVPVVSGVGHETDTTLTDFVADHRAPTPTAAAELVTPSMVDIQIQLKNAEQRLFHSMKRTYDREKARWFNVQQSPVIQYPERLYEPFYERLLRTTERLHYKINERQTEQRLLYKQLESRLTQQNPKHLVQRATDQQKQVAKRLQVAMKQTMTTHQHRFIQHVRLLTTLNPLQVLQRGFTMTYNEEKLMTSVQDVQVGDFLTVHVKDGTVRTRVEQINQMKGDKNGKANDDV